MKGEQLLFLPPDPSELHKKVERELGRVEGEDWEDFQEIVRYEVNARLAEIFSSFPKPHYEDIDTTQKICYKHLVSESRGR